MIEILQEMVYKDRLGGVVKDILSRGEYMGYNFCILSLGTHPTAYVECKLDNCDDYMDDKRLECISVHGGFTYIGNAYWDKEDKTSYLGWDYAHDGDLYFTGSSTSRYGKKWTTEEIIQEVFDVIKQLRVIENIKRQREAYYL